MTISVIIKLIHNLKRGKKNTIRVKDNSNALYL